MNWDDLKHFLAVARRKKLRRAGADLKVDQATVGRRIAALEGRLGAKLFERGPAGYELTEVGRRLLPSAERVEQEMRGVVSNAGRLGDGISGAVRLGAPVGAATYLVPASVASLCVEHPQLDVQIVTLPRTFDLSRREADMAVALSRPARGRLRSEKIGDYDLHLYATETFLATRPAIKRIEDLRSGPSVGYVSDLIFDPELDYAPLVDPEARPCLTSSDLNVQLHCTLSGGGACVLPAYMARHWPQLRRILVDEVSLTRTYWLVIHEDLVAVDRVRLTADRLIREIRLLLSAPQ